MVGIYAFCKLYFCVATGCNLVGTAGCYTHVTVGSGSLYSANRLLAPIALNRYFTQTYSFTAPSDNPAITLWAFCNQATGNDLQIAIDDVSLYLDGATCPAPTVV